MTLLVLVLLAVVWIAVLAPPWLRSLREGRPGDSISSFRRQLHTLQRATPGSLPAYRVQPATVRTNGPKTRPAGYGAPATYRAPSRSSAALARQRRRQVLFVLLGASAFTLLAVLSIGGTKIVLLHVLCDVALAGYIALLAQMQRQAAMFGSSVRYRSAA